MIVILSFSLLIFFYASTSKAQIGLKETSCADMIDNDHDGEIDCADNDCQLKSFCSPSETVCNDKFDNDGDGLTDCTDNDCSNQLKCKAICGNKTIEYPEQCDDGNQIAKDWCDQYCKLEGISCESIERIGPDINTVSVKINESQKHTTLQNINRWDWNMGPRSQSRNISHSYMKSGTYTIQTELVNSYNTGNKTLCEKSFAITNIPWCQDPYASNFNPESTINNQNCLYDASPIIQCKNIDFKANKKNVENKELITLSRNKDNQIKQTIVYPWEWQNIITKNNSIGVRYQTNGKKNPILILTTQSGFTTSCATSLIVWKLGCTVTSADNYDPSAEINDWSCSALTEDPVIQISETLPYQTGDKTIHTTIKYNGNKDRIKTTIILSQNQQARYTFTPKIQDDGSIKIPISFVQWELWYINPWNYEISIVAQHYKDSQSDTKRFVAYVWPTESLPNINDQHEENTQNNPKKCWNKITETTEECDSGRYCKECTIEWLSNKKKQQIENIVNNIIQKKPERINKNLNKEKLQQIANDYPFDNNIQEFAINIFLKKVKKVR